jgi:hypothetical protein
LTYPEKSGAHFEQMIECNKMVTMRNKPTTHPQMSHIMSVGHGLLIVVRDKDITWNTR